MSSQYLGQTTVGSEPRFTMTYKSLDGVAADPTTIILKLRKPDGTVVTIEKASMTSPTTGTWRALYTIDQSGRWWGRVKSTGTPAVASQFHFDVETEYPTG